MTERPIRLLIVDDHPLVREGVRQALSAPGFEVVGDAGSAEAGLELARAHAPDVVVMDITLPGVSGIQAVETLLKQLPATRVLMLSVHDHSEYVFECIRAGAHGYLRKDTLPEELRAAVRTVADGGTAFSGGPATPGRVVAPAASASTEWLSLLTRREIEVLTGIASGRANKAIAANLGLSVRTVESYRESLGTKLGITGTAGLTRFAIEAGLLTR
ncbi:MAG: response regulator transcription factor [Gemmatimonadaceae bacterium]